MSGAAQRGASEPRRDSEAAEMHSHAMENLRFIRRTMESAGSFTAVPGVGQMIIGGTALAAAVVAARQKSPSSWLAVWLVEAAAAAIVGVWAILRKARATGFSLSAGPARKFAICFAPPILAGAFMTPVLYRAGAAELLPGTWLLLFGVAVVTGGALSVRIVPFMGAAFMALGAGALLAPRALGDLFMALGFGALLIGFGAVIARRHGG